MRTFYTIADTHGLSLSNFEIDLNLLAKDENNTIVFTGDYCDSFSLSDSQHVKSLKEIIQFKKDNPNNVILLLGNHDIAYWYNTDPYDNISGFRDSYANKLHKIFMDNKDLFQIAYQYEEYLWTHAGVQNYWFKNIFAASKEEKNTNDIAMLLNNHFWSNNRTLFVVGIMRGGWHKSGGITWCDERELYNSPIKGFTQIIGHTPQKGGIPIVYESYNKQTYICCDVYNYMLWDYETKKRNLWAMIKFDDLKDGIITMDDFKLNIKDFIIPESAIYKLTL